MAEGSRRHAVTTIIACALVLAAQTRANAQADTVEAVRPRPQLGVSAGAIFILPTLGARLTVPFQPRLAVEGVAEFLPLTFDDGDSTYVLLQLQLRHQFRSGGSWPLHGTYGMTFFGEYTHRHERRESRPDGSVLVWPSYRRLSIEPPLAVHGGVGGERLISPRVIVGWDAQVLLPATERSFFLPRGTINVSWRPGSGR